MSVAQVAQENGVSIEFFPHACFVKDLRTGRIIMDGIEVNRMYKMGGLPISDQNKSQVTTPACFHIRNVAAPDSTLNLWHQRLGHPHVDAVKSTLRAADISCSSSSIFPFCQACQLGKAHKLPFTPSTTVYSKPLELITMDLWGPAPVASHGFLYYIAFVDAFSRFTWIYPLKHKSDALQTFKIFKALVENRFCDKIKMIQSDNGGEFLSFKSFVQACGIEHRFTCPYTSEQNGLVERRHRLIVETGLAMLARASLPIFYWSDAFCTAAFLSNRVSSSALSGASPFEKLSNYIKKV